MQNYTLQASKGVLDAFYICAGGVDVFGELYGFMWHTYRTVFFITITAICAWCVWTGDSIRSIGLFYLKLIAPPPFIGANDSLFFAFFVIFYVFTNYHTISL
jgi:hypothetical protein